MAPPINPFHALRFHFGMLLGVEDFETEQGYHRGKSRLHNAWLHGGGVVWGYPVSAALEAGEIRVGAGLALDRAGHELYLDGEQCVRVGAWFDAHRADPGLTVVTGEDGAVTFDAWVAVRFRTCLSREVPALAEPCAGAGADTAFSRLDETVELLLLPSPPPPRPPSAFHRVRLLLGIDAPAVDGGGAVTADDQAVLDRRTAIAALPAADRPAACVEALRVFAALDATARRPFGADDDRSLFPADEREPVVLARVDGIRLEPVEGAEGAWRLAAATVDPTVRPSLLPTAEIQDLVCGHGAGAAPAPAAPAFAVEVVDDRTVRAVAVRELVPGTVVPAAFAVTSRPADPASGAPWAEHAIAGAALDADLRTITLSLADDGPMPSPGLVRVLARCAGPAPLLGSDLAPLSGADFVTQLTREA